MYDNSLEIPTIQHALGDLQLRLWDVIVQDLLNGRRIHLSYFFFPPSTIQTKKRSTQVLLRKKSVRCEVISSARVIAGVTRRLPIYTPRALPRHGNSAAQIISARKQCLQVYVYMCNIYRPQEVAKIFTI